MMLSGQVCIKVHVYMKGRNTIGKQLYSIMFWILFLNAVRLMEQIISQAWPNYWILFLLFIADIELQACLNLFDSIHLPQILVWEYLGDLEANSCLKQWGQKK